MASPPLLQTPLLLLLLLLAFFSAQTHARESQFFSKTTREQQPTEDTPTTRGPDSTTATEKERVPAALPPQPHGGYGLYSRGADRFQPAATATATAGRYGTYNYNGGGGGVRDAEVENEELSGVYNYGKQSPPQDNRPSRFSDEYDPTAATTEWSDAVDPNKQSYSYGVNGGRDQFAYSSQRLRGNPDGFGVYNYGGRTVNYGGRRDGYGSGYEKNMDESREEFDP